MRYRPWSSVTTILANFVGRSVVSAITHTPASGPLALVTTPPRSDEPMLTPGGALDCAESGAGSALRAAAMTIAVALRSNFPTVPMSDFSLPLFRPTALLGGRFY